MRKPFLFLSFLGVFAICGKASAYTSLLGLDVNCPNLSTTFNPPLNPVANPANCTATTVRPANDVDNAPRIPFPNSLAQATNFTNFLSSFGANTFGTQTFETFATGATGPFALDFPTITSPTTVSATLTGVTASVIASAAAGQTDGNGRYPISGTQYLQSTFDTTGSFNIVFNRSISALGFYGVDIGDFNGGLAIELRNGVAGPATTLNVLPANFYTGPLGRLSGSVLFFGVFANTPAEQFDRVTFRLTNNAANPDTFAFDNLTVGLQVPGPLPVLGFAAAFGWSRKLRKRIQQS